MEWNTEIKNQDQLEKELMAHEVMRLRRDCERMYDVIQHIAQEIGDAYETPDVNLPEKLYQARQSALVITGHVERGRAF